jgi:peroxiredoxin
MSQLLIGSRAPDFELPDINGVCRRLSHGIAHGPVWLVFYKSSCPTCEFTLPHIEKIFSAAGHGAEWKLWGISEDDAGDTRDFAVRLGITFDLLIDEYPYEVSAAYGLEFVPAMFQVRQDGTIAASETGFTKAGLNQMAGYEFFSATDGLPAFRRGCRAKV